MNDIPIFSNCTFYNIGDTVISIDGKVYACMVSGTGGNAQWIFFLNRFPYSQNKCQCGSKKDSKTHASWCSR